MNNNDQSDPRPDAEFGTSSDAFNALRVTDARSKTIRTTSAQSRQYAASEWGVALDPRNKSPLAPNEVNDDSLIRMRGAELTIGQARQIGWLKGGSGFEAEASHAQAASQEQPAQQEQQEQPQQEQQPQHEQQTIGEKGEQTLEFLCRHTSETDQLKAVEQLAEVGEISENTLGQLASQLGGQPAQISSMIEALRPAFEAQANQAVEAFGVDPQDVYDWAWESAPKQMQGAISNHITARNTEAYKALARTYVAKLDTINPDAILSAEVNGAKVHRDHAGRIVFTTPDGRTYGWSEVVNAGWMKLGRKK